MTTRRSLCKSNKETESDININTPNNFRTCSPKILAAILMSVNRVIFNGPEKQLNEPKRCQ